MKSIYPKKNVGNWGRNPFPDNSPTSPADPTGEGLKSVEIEILNMDIQHKRRMTLRKFYHENKEECCDTTFVVQERKVKGYKYLLAVSSAVFKKMLYGGTENADGGVVKVLDCVHPVAFSYLVEYCMTGYAKFPLVEALPLLHLSQKYEVNEIIPQLTEKIIQTITPKNSFEVYRIGKDLETEEKIISQCFHFFNLDPYKTVLENANLSKLSKSAFEDFLLLVNFCPNRKSGDHLIIYDAIVKWSKANDTQNFGGVAKELILKYIDFRLYRAPELRSLKRPLILDFEMLFELAIFVQEEEEKAISSFFSNESATLKTLDIGKIPKPVNYQTKSKSEKKKKSSPKKKKKKKEESEGEEEILERGGKIVTPEVTHVTEVQEKTVEEKKIEVPELKTEPIMSSRYFAAPVVMEKKKTEHKFVPRKIKKDMSSGLYHFMASVQPNHDEKKRKKRRRKGRE